MWLVQNAQKIAHVSLADIQWKPEEFPTMLTAKYKFKQLRAIVNPSQQAGFDRVVYCFKKLDS